MKNLAGFNRDFRFTEQKHICADAKRRRRSDVHTENSAIKRKTFMKNHNIMFTTLMLVLACSAALPTALARPPRPTPTPSPTATPTASPTVTPSPTPTSTPVGDLGNGNTAI